VPPGTPTVLENRRKIDAQPRQGRDGRYGRHVPAVQRVVRGRDAVGGGVVPAPKPIGSVKDVDVPGDVGAPGFVLALVSIENWQGLFHRQKAAYNGTDFFPSLNPKFFVDSFTAYSGL
jgi:hypothetical protein